MLGSCVTSFACVVRGDIHLSAFVSDSIDVLHKWDEQCRRLLLCMWSKHICFKEACLGSSGKISLLSVLEK